MLEARKIDVFVDPELEREIEGVGEIVGEYPIRNFDVIEFYKIVKSKKKIIAVTFDVESHIISFQFGSARANDPLEEKVN